MEVKKMLSVVCGVIFGILAYLILKVMNISGAGILAVFTGILFHCLLDAFLLYYEKWLSKRYAEAEKSIIEPVFYKSNGNIRMGKHIRNANVYLCASGLVIISLDEKPYLAEEIMLNKISVIEIKKIGTIKIYTHDDRIIELVTKGGQEIIEKMKEQGWIR